MSPGRCPTPADEPGVGETHDFEGSVPEARGSAEPGMDIDLAEENTDVDLKRMTATLREIMAVLNRPGADTLKYRRERSESIRAVVSGIYFPRE